MTPFLILALITSLIGCLLLCLKVDDLKGQIIQQEKEDFLKQCQEFAESNNEVIKRREDDYDWVAIRIGVIVNENIRN